MLGSKKLRTLAQRQSKLQQESERIRGKMVSEIVELMEAHGIEWSHVRDAVKKRAELQRPTTGRQARRPVRYRDPKTGETWAGVGQRPRWLNERLDQGRTLDEFYIGSDRK